MNRLALHCMAMMLLLFCLMPKAIFAQDDTQTSAEYPCAAYLKTLRLPPQKFSVPADKPTYIQLAQGTKLFIPARCMILDDGPNYNSGIPVSGVIDLEITEVVDPLAFALYNIPTQYTYDESDNVLAAHGAVRIKARVNGSKLRLENSSCVLVLFENHPASGASGLHGRHDDTERIQWERTYYPGGDDFAGKLTPKGAEFDQTYPYLGHLGKASPFTRRFGEDQMAVEDLLLAGDVAPPLISDWSSVRLWVDGKGYPKALEGVHGGIDGSHLWTQVLKQIQWDVKGWDTLKPIRLQPRDHSSDPVGSAVPEEHIIFSNTVRAIERKHRLEEMLSMMPRAQVGEFMAHGQCIDKLGWSMVGREVDAGKEQYITVDLGQELADAKVFMVLRQDTIVVEAESEGGSIYKFPAVPPGQLAQIVAMGYSGTFGALLGVELIETRGGLHTIPMKSLPWSSLQAMRRDR